MSKSSAREFTIHLKSGNIATIEAESFKVVAEEIEFYSSGQEKIADLYVPKDEVAAIIPKRFHQTAKSTTQRSYQ